MSRIYKLSMTDLNGNVSFGGGSRAGRMAEVAVCGVAAGLVGGAAGAVVAAVTKSPAAGWGAAGAAGGLTNEVCRDGLGWDGE